MLECPWNIEALFINGISNVDITVFISGFFRIKYSGKRIIKFHNTVWFYSILYMLLIFIVDATNISVKFVISSMLPVVSGGSQSFVAHYFWLMLFSPFLNRIVDAWERLYVKRLLVVSLILYNIISTLLYFDMSETQGKGFGYMILIYLLGRYFGTYHKSIEVKTSKIILIILVSYATNVILNILITRMIEYRQYFARDCSFFILIEAIGLFYLFKRIKLRSRAINFIASACLGGLLCERIVTLIVYRFRLNQFVIIGNFGMLITHFIYALGIFSVAICIELVRKAIFTKADNVFIEFQYKKLKGVVERSENTVMRFEFTGDNDV